MPEVVLGRLTGTRRRFAVPGPLPEILTLHGVRYVHQRHADVIDGRPRYVEAPEAPPRVRPCLHGCPGCGAVEPRGEVPCPVAVWQVRRCAACRAVSCP